MYRFLFTPKWFGWFALAVAACIACVLLGNWQMNRRTHVVANIDRIEANYHQSPVPFSEAGRYFADFDAAHEWLPVQMTGTYDVGGQRVVRNRPLGGQPGYEVVVPLRLTSGQTVIIDRGWLPIGNDTPGRPDTVPAPPSGVVTVVARLSPGEPTLDRGAPSGQLASIDLPTYAEQLNYPILTSAYGRLASEDPAPATTPVALPMPSTDEGPHLSYSMQWYAFGALAFVAYGYGARQTARNGLADEDDWDEEWDGGDGPDTGPDNGPEGGNTEPARMRHNAAGRPVRARPVRARRRPTAEEEEDALLDAYEAAQARETNSR